MKKLTQEDFINRAQIVHYNKYDYTLVNYINSQEKIKIICRVHGMFEQTPANHLRKVGCSKCGSEQLKIKLRLDLSSFMSKANEVHKNKYDYSLVEYINNKTKVAIVCSLHGKFAQQPDCHLQGQGCPKCNKPEKLNTKKFVARARMIHKHKYDYSLVEYCGNGVKVSVVCKVHGVFLQTPRSHLQGQGCRKCAGVGLSNTQEFVAKSSLIFNNEYDYSLTKYIKNSEKVTIICKKHGEFRQTANSHLSGHGCLRCRHQSSKLEIIWLDQHDVPLDCRNKILKINDRRFNVDGLDLERKIIYEFYGDFWHGNPKVYWPKNENWVTKEKFVDLYNQTMERENIFRMAGYTVVSIWESDFIQ